jgi:hypothetical protein
MSMAGSRMDIGLQADDFLPYKAYVKNCGKYPLG